MSSGRCPSSASTAHPSLSPSTLLSSPWPGLASLDTFRAELARDYNLDIPDWDAESHDVVHFGYLVYW